LVQNNLINTEFIYQKKAKNCSDIYNKNNVLNTILILVDETVIFCKYYILIRMILIIDGLVKFIYFSLLFNRLHCWNY